MNVSSLRKKGFTLIELLVVIAVISMLMGLILSGGIAARKRAKIYQAKAMIASLETALALYHTDFGAYPASGVENLIDLLTNTAYNSYPDWQGPYLSLKEDDTRGSFPNKSVIDPWGIDYNYNLEPTPPPDYKIWSCGPDQNNNSGSGDDIKSW